MIFDKANILVVTDDLDIGEFLIELLLKDGYKVSGAPSMSDALYMLKNDIFDILLSDLNLPDKNAAEGIKDIKKVSPHSRVIIMTGYPSLKTAISTMKDGAVDYLKKPFSNEGLLNVIRNNIDIKLMENIYVAIGEKIKAIRKGKGIKIKQLSGRSGLTESSISMIENAKISPSITTVHKISAALGVHPIEFFGIEKHKKLIITRKGEREQLQFGSQDNVLEYIMKFRSSTKNEIFISCLGPAQKSFDQPVTHEGHKFGYILSGTAELKLGDEKIMLNEGDLIYFDAVTPHVWKNTESRESKTLWVVNRE